MSNGGANIPIKVLHICSDDLWGGAEMQVLLLLEGLKSNYSSNVESGILTFNKNELTKKLESGSIAETFNADEKAGFLSLFNSSLKQARSFNPDIIISHGYKENFIAALLKFVLKTKWIHQIHGNSENYKGTKQIKSAAYSFIEMFLAKNFASRIICVSNATKETFELSNSKKCVVIYNGSKKLETPTLEKSVHNGNIKIFIIGRLAPIKRVDLAIAAIKKSLAICPNIELHVVGDGPLRVELETQAYENGEYRDKIFFHGFLTDSHILLKAEGDFLILTSDNEGIPTVILEAIHSKIPVIARSVGGISEIKNKIPTYPLILMGDSNPNAIANVISDSVKRLEALRISALNCDTSFFEVNRVAKEHLDIYAELVNK